MSQVRTRFAPSPTGRLHVGNARTAVLNWLIARHHDGEFVLRIEDTDAGRNVVGAEAALMEDLLWLGLEWDEGPDPAGGEERGDRGPYRQSARGAVYRRYADRLLEADAAYPCFCTPEALEADRRRALEEGRNPHYAGTCRRLSRDVAAERTRADTPHVLRLATPASGEVVVEDAIRGAVRFDAADIGDFVLVRSDGVPTYNFAVVVDDAEMAITHVIRGSGHLSNTAHQLLLYEALGLEPPTFAHTPTVLGDDRSKLSKRSGAQSLEELREAGFHPDAVVNYLSLLGWSSPSEEEVLDRDRLIAELTLERMNAGDTVFDPEKMRWLSGQHIARMSLEELTDAVRPYVSASRYAALLDHRFPTALEAVRSRLTTFGEITDHLAPFVGPPAAPGGLSEEAVGVLRSVREHLGGLETWGEEEIGAALREAGRASDARGRELYVPVRRTLTGEDHGPPLAAVLAVQGREAVLAQLDRVVAASAGEV